MNAASSGDLILLADGVFSGSGNNNITIVDKAIGIVSASVDPLACTIDGGWSDGNSEPVFWIEGPFGVEPDIVAIRIVDSGAGPNGMVRAEGPCRFERMVFSDFPEGSTRVFQSFGGNGLVYMLDCRFTDTAPEMFWGTDGPSILDTEFPAQDDGPLTAGGDPFFLRCTFLGYPPNSALLLGQSVYLRYCEVYGGDVMSGGLSKSPYTQLSHCRFRGGQTLIDVTAGEEVDALFSVFLDVDGPVFSVSGPNSEVRIEDCYFTGGLGGVEHDQAAIVDVRNQGTATLARTILRGNDGGSSASLLLVRDSGSVLQVSSTTVLGNHVGACVVAGSGSTTTISSCNFAFNSSAEAFRCEGVPSAASFQYTNVFESGTYNCFDDLGSINENPLFCDLLSGDSRLQLASPMFHPDWGFIGSATWTRGIDDFVPLDSGCDIVVAVGDSEPTPPTGTLLPTPVRVGFVFPELGYDIHGRAVGVARQAGIYFVRGQKIAVLR